MASDSSRIRASDGDRDRVAALLQEHHAEGRLSAEEFSERLDVALNARTMGELDELLADLPHVDRRRYQLPDAGIKPWPDRLYDAGGARSGLAGLRWAIQFAKRTGYRVNSRSARGLFFSLKVPTARRLLGRTDPVDADPAVQASHSG
jgi:Domain of unknown function (DUF1707)